MRLSDTVRTLIREAALRHFGAPVRLFGSRLDDNARGGDIDLYLECDLPAEEIAKRRILLLAQLHRELGERRIDLVVDNHSVVLPIHDAGRNGVLL
jgi:predicted nucleotidyltransferase